MSDKKLEAETIRQIEMMQKVHGAGQVSDSSLLNRLGVPAMKLPVEDYSKSNKDIPVDVYGPTHAHSRAAQLQKQVLEEMMRQREGQVTSANDRAIEAIRRADELLGQVEQAKRADPLLVATNEVLAEENRRLNGENARLSQENEALRRRLDEAHDRLYKTIDILQEKLHGSEEVTRGGEQPPAAREQEAPGVREGARGDQPCTLSVVAEA